MCQPTYYQTDTLSGDKEITFYCRNRVAVLTSMKIATYSAFLNNSIKIRMDDVLIERGSSLILPVSLSRISV